VHRLEPSRGPTRRPSEHHGSTDEGTPTTGAPSRLGACEGDAEHAVHHVPIGKVLGLDGGDGIANDLLLLVATQGAVLDEDDAGVKLAGMCQLVEVADAGALRG
jgi:hypothetical protein